MCFSYNPEAHAAFAQASETMSTSTKKNPFVFLFNLYDLANSTSDNLLLLKEMHCREKIVKRDFSIRNLFVNFT